MANDTAWFQTVLTPVASKWGFSQSSLLDGLLLGIAFLAENFFLELLSVSYVRALLADSRYGLSLYLQAVVAVMFNMLVLTPIVFATVALYLTDTHWSLPVQAFQVVSAITVHSVLYYCAHRAMHTPQLYWAHRFHHRFCKHITPVVANAVTPIEFVIAYAVPFTIYAKLLNTLGCAPDHPSVHVAIVIISVSNLAIHTPWLVQLSTKYLPAWVVGADDHFEHHLKLSKNYAAPTFNVDVAVSSTGKFARLLDRVFGKAYEKPVRPHKE